MCALRLPLLLLLLLPHPSFPLSLPPIPPPSRIPAATAADDAWADAFLAPDPSRPSSPFATTHGLFSAVSSYISAATDPDTGTVASLPFVLPRPSPASPPLLHFSSASLEAAVRDDFLDAGQGSTDKNKGWKMMQVGSVRGDSFADARLTYQEVQASLEKGTVIVNSAGAHISHTLAPACLAALDGSGGSAAGVCLNMYITKFNQKTSAPPHTDRQDVVVVQTQGAKRWRVFSPPLTSLAPDSDPFARGKGDDDLPLHLLGKSSSSLLLDVVLQPGDCLFVPARFPHTTGTEEGCEGEKTSIHLTFGLDTHVWENDFLSLRKFALARFGVPDVLGGGGGTFDEYLDTRYSGNVNLQPPEVVANLLSSFSQSLLDIDPVSDPEQQKKVATVAAQAMRLHRRIAQSDDLALEDWEACVWRFKEHGERILEVHRDMYLAAVAEGERRVEEGWDPELATRTELQSRLSLFRVPPFYEQLDEAKASLRAWAGEGGAAGGAGEGGEGAGGLEEGWERTHPLAVGDAVEVDLGGAMFEATVTKEVGGGFDVVFFDGDVEAGVAREDIVLLTPPAPKVQATKKKKKKKAKEKRQRQ